MTRDHVLGSLPRGTLGPAQDAIEKRKEHGMRSDGVPETPLEMKGMVFHAILTRAYGDVSKAATTRRLAERDIRLIEEKALAVPADLKALAQEFKTFEAEPAIVGAVQMAKEFFAIVKAGRLKQR